MGQRKEKTAGTKREIYKEREKQERTEKPKKREMLRGRQKQLKGDSERGGTRRAEAAVLLWPGRAAGQWVGPGTRVCAHRPGC